MMETKFKIGETVKLRCTWYRVPSLRAVKVVRHGRKYVYIEGFKEGFDAVTGRMQGSDYYRLVTDEDLAFEEEVKNAEQRLRAWDVETWRLSKEKILAMYNAMKTAGLVE